MKKINGWLFGGGRVNVITSKNDNCDPTETRSLRKFSKDLRDSWPSNGRRDMGNEKVTWPIGNIWVEWNSYWIDGN